MDNKNTEEIYWTNRVITDQYILKLYSKHNLGNNPSIDDIERVVTPLLDAGNIAEGLSILLGRVVESEEILNQENPFWRLYFTKEGEDRFAAALLILTDEQILIDSASSFKDLES